MEKGLVIKNTGSWYLVKTDDNRQIECKIKGNFRLKGIRSTNPIAVGDRVQISINAEGTVFITEIEDRKNYIIRRASNLSKQSHIIAANLNQCMLIVTVNYPETSTTFIDRFLASAEAYRVPVCLVFNKIDRYSDEELQKQAAGVAYAWKKVNALEGIDAWQWHNWFDHPGDGACLGLRKYLDESYNGEPKPAWYVYQKANTHEEDEFFEQFLPIIGISDWNIIEKFLIVYN